MRYTEKEISHIRTLLYNMLTHIGFSNMVPPSGSLLGQDYLIRGNIVIILEYMDRTLTILSKEMLDSLSGQIWVLWMRNPRPYLRLTFNGKKHINSFTYVLKKSPTYEKFKFYYDQITLKQQLEKL